MRQSKIKCYLKRGLVNWAESQSRRAYLKNYPIVASEKARRVTCVKGK